MLNTLQLSVQISSKETAKRLRPLPVWPWRNGQPVHMVQQVDEADGGLRVLFPIQSPLN